MKDTFRLVAVLLVAAVAAAAAVIPVLAMHGGGADSPSAFRQQGDEQWGALHARLESSGLEVSVLVSDWKAMWGPPPGLFLAVAPHQVPDADTAVLDRLLEGGASVIVVDPEGSLNTWSRSYDVGVSSLSLVDVEPPIEGGVRLTDSAGGEVWARSPRSLVIDGEGWEPVLQTADTAYLDLDGDGNVDETDRPGPFVVAASRALPTGGTLVVSADRSHLTDAMMAAGPGNAESLEGLVTRLADGGAVILDESHLSWQPRERWPAASTRAAAAVVGAGLTVSLILLASFIAGGIQATAAVEPTPRFTPHVPSDPVTLPGQHPRNDRTDQKPEFDHDETRT